MDNANLYERYQRQLILSGFGEEAQRKLLNAKVLVIGAGGLGCPVLQYLAAAGVGAIGIVDDDLVQLNNLHRQVLYAVDDIGFSKAERAGMVLSRLNPDIKLLVYNQRITNTNALDLCKNFDVIVDGSDNFATRYMINDACVLLKKPLVYGAISQFEGQLTIFRNQTDTDVNYRDIFPDPPKDGEVLSCAEAGVLGVLPGIIGTMMANETIKFIAGIGTPLVNQLLTYNALSYQVYELSLSVQDDSRKLIPGTEDDFKKMDYEWLCSAPSVGEEIDADRFNEIIANETADLVDIRELKELPEVTEFSSLRIPLSVLRENASRINSETVVLFCQTGKRSMQAINTLKAIFGDSKRIYSLRGGILEWKKQNQVV